MNEYTKIRNAHDRAVILAQLVNADARVAAEEIARGLPKLAWLNYERARDELWKLIGPAEEGEPSDSGVGPNPAR